MCGAVITGFGLFRHLVPSSFSRVMAAEDIRCGCHSLTGVTAHLKLVMLCFLGGSRVLGSEPGALLDGCSLFSLPLSQEPLDHRGHLTSICRLCSGEGSRDSTEWMAAVLRIIQVVCF